MAGRQPAGQAQRTGAAQAQRTGAAKDKAARTLAQTTCLLLGVVLIAVGVLGFIFAGTGFDTGSSVDGEELIIFEVNGWHNIVHLATGAFLLLMAPKAKAAITGLLVFGVVYAVVTAWGFIDGNDVLSLVPVNTADNVLHLALTAAALLVAISAGGLAKSAGRA